MWPLWPEEISHAYFPPFHWRRRDVLDRRCPDCFFRQLLLLSRADEPASHDRDPGREGATHSAGLLRQWPSLFLALRQSRRVGHLSHVRRRRAVRVLLGVFGRRESLRRRWALWRP